MVRLSSPVEMPGVPWGHGWAMGGFGKGDMATHAGPRRSQSHLLLSQVLLVCFHSEVWVQVGVSVELSGERQRGLIPCWPIELPGREDVGGARQRALCAATVLLSASGACELVGRELAGLCLVVPVRWP